MTNKPDDVTYDMEKLETEAQAFMDKYKLRMKDLSDEILGQLYCKVMPYLETDTWTNYRESLRLELEHEYQFSNFKKDWATRFRRAVFVENREEISKLIEADILKRIKHLEDCRQEYDIFRYSPGGDRYQDIVRERDSLKAEAEKLAAASQKYLSSRKDWIGIHLDTFAQALTEFRSKFPEEKQ